MPAKARKDKPLANNPIPTESQDIDRPETKVDSPTPAGPPAEAADRATDQGIHRQALFLGIALALGGVAVWILRESWAKPLLWPWLLLLAAAFAAAASLKALGPWLPGFPIAFRPSEFPPAPRRVWGTRCFTGALLVTALIVLLLWPDYRHWHGTQFLWLVALALVVAGAILIGAVGSAAQRAATAVAIWSSTVRTRGLEIAAFALIFLLAIFLRTYRLASIPPGIYVDETNAGLDALYVLEGRDVSPFATGWYGTPNGYIYYMAGIFGLLGANWTSLKLVSLLPAILTIPAVYLLGRMLFGNMAGLIAMLLMAVSRWHLSLSRWGWNETAPPFFQVLAVFFLIRGLRDRRALDYALSGLLSGLSVYTYLSARLAALTIVLYVLFWFLSDPAGLRASLARSGLGILIMAGAAVVAIAPLGVTYARDPFSFGNRVSEISIFRDVKDQGSYAPLFQNLEDVLKFFHQTGDLQGKHNLPGEPMTDPFTGLLFAIGFASALLGLRDQRRVLLLMWLVIGMAGSYLSSHHESPQSYRSLTALPAVVLLAADALDRIGRTLLRYLRTLPFFGQRVAFPSLATGAFLLLFLSGATLWESNVYFGRQANSIPVASGFNPTENGVARETISALGAGKTVYLSPGLSEFSPLRFLLYGVVKAQTGQNTLDIRPYQLIRPGVDLPLPVNGHDALLLLDSTYWALRDYFSSFYPKARMDLIQMPDGSPLYMRIQLANADLAALQGLTETSTLADGSTPQRVVTQISADEGQAQPSAVTWEGGIRLDDGGEYDLQGENGLQVMIDGKPWPGPHYLGGGLYRLKASWAPGAGGKPALIWKTPGRPPEPIPPQVLFHFATAAQGLLGSYYNNTNWEGAPQYQQITPFLLLAWPDKPPVPTTGAFSARFQGALRITDPGSYGLRIEADDGARLTLDGKVLGEGLVPNQPNSFELTVPLTPGDHPITVDYVQFGGGSALRFLWRFGSEPWTPVPPAALVPAAP